MTGVQTCALPISTVSDVVQRDKNFIVGGEEFSLPLAFSSVQESDNVVRAGLTDKWVDVAELRRLLVPAAGDGAPLEAVVDERTGATCYPVRADEFALAVFGATVGPVPVDSSGPEILLCGDGTVRVAADGEGAVHELGRSDALFVPARCATYRVESSGTLYRATVGVHAHRPG